mgnify:CR=1 FL=1|jgi:intracellular multiplication protein IcmW
MTHALDLKNTHEFWQQFDDPTIYRVVSAMESVEEWTKDGDPALEQAIEKLSEAFEELSGFNIGEQENFIKLATFLKMPRLLRMLQLFDTTEPGCASKLLMYAEENSNGNEMVSLFLRRNIVFERLRLLSRVFSPSRFSIILRALEND